MVMKSQILAIALLLLSNPLWSINHGRIPEVVLEAYKNEYKEVKAHWTVEGKNFEAEFKYQGRSTSVLYDSLGNKLETETECAWSEIPEKLTQKIKVMFPKAHIKETSRLLLADGSVLYEFEVKGQDVFLNENAEIVIR